MAEDDDRALRVRLFSILYRQFNLSELRTLCFLLEIDYDGLGGENKADKARELIEYLERRGQLDALIEAGRELRADIRWPDAGSSSPAPALPSTGLAAADRPGQVERSEDLAGCVFISYDRSDQAYARRLADELRDRGLKPWMDDRIDFGDRWWQTIVRAGLDSAAFVVVMTPEAERSRWVEREVFLAEREGKPIVPLLLHGRPFSLLINVQYVDVMGDRMPPQVFYDRLDRALGRPAAPGAAASEPGAPEPSVREARIGRGERADRPPATPKAPSPAAEGKKLPASSPLASPSNPRWSSFPPASS